MKRILIISIAAIVFSGVFFYSCIEKKDRALDPETVTKIVPIPITKERVIINGGDYWSIVKLRGECEWLKTPTGTGAYLYQHIIDCTNPDCPLKKQTKKK